MHSYRQATLHDEGDTPVHMNGHFSIKALGLHQLFPSFHPSSSLQVPSKSLATSLEAEALSLEAHFLEVVSLEAWSLEAQFLEAYSSFNLNSHKQHSLSIQLPLPSPTKLNKFGMQEQVGQFKAYTFCRRLILKAKLYKLKLQQGIIEFLFFRLL